ncbi:MAG TPA: hypothetical protein VHC22_32665 [Pirellulales bacterium]|nr:hypothetical protein [Pirellulales bacterium]
MSETHKPPDCKHLLGRAWPSNDESCGHDATPGQFFFVARRARMRALVCAQRARSAR